jgi:hypothetical protein
MESNDIRRYELRCFLLATTVCVALIAIAGTIATGQTQAPDIPFTQITVDRSPPERPWFKMLGDIDGDGLLDIVVAGSKGPLVWYKNPTWTRNEIAAGGWSGVNGEVVDIDGDGDADLVLGGIVWFRNPGDGQSGNRMKWALVRIDNQSAHDIEIGDLDLDGKWDIVARDQSAFGDQGNTIYVYYQRNPTSWERHTRACPHGEGLKLADLDSDGDLDVVIGALWYENTRQRGNWVEHCYAAGWSEPDTKVEVADLNGDGRVDIVLTPAELRGERYKIAWFAAPAKATDGNWQEHVIQPDVEAVIHALASGDFNLDGGIDLAIAEMHQGADPDEVSLFVNQGQGARWKRQVLSTRGSHDIVVGDVDNDGDPDIVGANHGGDFQSLQLWRNETRPSPNG